MEGDAPQVKDVSQAPQQPPVVPQIPPEPTPPPKPKKWLKIILIILLVLIGLGVGGFFIWKNISAPEEKLEEKEEVSFSEEEKEPEPEAGFEWFQDGNTESMTKFQYKKSKELEDNRMSSMVTLHPHIHTESPNYFANRINDTGLKWMKVSIDPFDWPEAEKAGLYSEHYVHPEQDEAITALANNGINVIYVLVYWDEEILAKQGKGYSRFKTEDEIQDYLDYVRFIVNHFKGQIGYYEILNEPNVRRGTQQYVKVADYINLVERTVSVIREEDPDAKIMAGAVTPLNEPPYREYFFDILKSDIMPLVDAVSFHSLGAEGSPEFGSEDYYNCPALLQEIKDTASSHGFTGEYIAGELQFRTLEEYHPHEPWVHTKIAAAKYLARGIITHLGMNFTTGLAGCLECQYKMIVIQILSTLMAEVEAISLPIEIQSEATNIMSYTFSLSNGDKLIALWTDGVAVDDDPGVNATLVFEGLSGKEAIGVDILNGYVQPLRIEGDSIKDLIVRDYPLILHIK